MSYTEVPTELVWDAYGLLCPLEQMYEESGFNGDVEYKVANETLYKLLPLFRWLDYFQRKEEAPQICSCPCGAHQHLTA